MFNATYAAFQLGLIAYLGAATHHYAMEMRFRRAALFTVLLFGNCVTFMQTLLSLIEG